MNSYSKTLENQCSLCQQIIHISFVYTSHTAGREGELKHNLFEFTEEEMILDS